jgi:hypothetical protein
MRADATAASRRHGWMPLNACLSADPYSAAPPVGEILTC